MLTIAPPPLRDHLRNLELHAEEDALQVDAHDPVVLVLGEFRGQLVGRHPGVVDGVVQPAECVDGFSHQGLAPIGRGDVAGRKLGLAAFLLDQPCGLLAAVAGRLEIGHQDGGALSAELDRDPAADPAGRARDQSGLSRHQRPHVPTSVLPINRTAR
jgi:hypothetical protein